MTGNGWAALSDVRLRYLVEANQKELAPGDDNDYKDKGYPAGTQEHEDLTQTSHMACSQAGRDTQPAAMLLISPVQRRPWR